MSERSGRVLLLGNDGMLGHAWQRLLGREGIEHETRSYPELDLTRREQVMALPGEGIALVVNCTGWTDVDGAETQEAAATALNGDGVGWLAEHCAAAGATLVHYSTDYVFSGDSARASCRLSSSLHSGSASSCRSRWSYAVASPRIAIAVYGCCIPSTRRLMGRLCSNIPAASSYRDRKSVV